MSTSQGASLFSSEVKTIEGESFQLSKFKGKTLLIVNIATQCGFTPQLKGLEAMYKKFKSKGLVVVGVPSNDFGGQTPEQEAEVKNFCVERYGVTFPLTSKMKVVGDSKNKLIVSLLQNSNDKSDIKWNFEKFLINKNGEFVNRYNSKVTPEQITEDLVPIL